MPRKTRRTSNTEPPQQQEIIIRTVKPKNEEQTNLIKVIHRNQLIFLTGLSGCGKSYVSAGLASEYLERNLIERVIISRPVVGSEYQFGTLPGEIADKLMPYLNPLIQELSYFINVKKYIAEEKIVILPVSFMRGYTFRDSFVLVDECSNLTYNQLKMILTRLGENTKMILNGDTEQSDLSNTNKRDFFRVIEKLKPVINNPDNKVAHVELKQSVRHPLIKTLLNHLEES